ncbi:RlpA-like double-psi beta-barrel-protein domain-containing protein-containing protein [Flagelloscypha sp. PMI_526]|nr:RlpA-like double-psi beta-barrel-protein domain-containing protein-containing protein [Flagelloscypha sp. PMI_526]
MQFTLVSSLLFATLALAAPVARAPRTGQMTFYNIPPGAFTSCGAQPSDADNVVAVSKAVFDSFPGATPANPNANPICGKEISVSFQGKTTTAKVLDICPSCAPDDIDLTPAAFNALADPAAGRVSGVTWDFV